MIRSAVAATIGVFDGVHRGHAALVEETRRQALRLGGRAVAFTFDPHPARVLAPDHAAPPLLTLMDERQVRLLELGIDHVHVLKFDREMAMLSPEDFLEAQLFSREMIRHLALGYDFALGRERAGTPARLTAIGKDRGFEVTTVPPLLDGGEVISSTRIRRAIRAADFSLAGALLGRPYRVAGNVVSGDARGREIGFPTANLSVPAELLLPPHGVYAGRVYSDSGTLGGEGHPTVMNFGVRPTFGGGDPVLELHLIGFKGDLLGTRLALEFAGRIRGEMKFDGPVALAEQIRHDIRAARSLVGGDPTGAPE